MQYPQIFDVIVIGGGHAGTEAALAAARRGSQTLLLTDNIDTIGQMSCNPAIGGIGKGHLVKEVDALGGAMAQAADLAGIQFRILNARKGPAVRATRAQADRALYRQAIQNILQNTPNLYIFAQSVADIALENQQLSAVITTAGITFRCRAAVLTVGTFLNGKIHIGMSQSTGGRAGCPASTVLAGKLRDLGLKVGRLKTGTPPRIDARSVDFSQLPEQHGDTPLPIFSFLGDVSQHPRQVPCHITYTNLKTHDIIRQGLDESPMYQGVIEGTGPRYCPSIEDKIMRFADKDRHQIFIEPEGLNSHELYPNGISTSLGFATQLALVRSIAGFENAHITRPGYAIEYDYFDPRDLNNTLHSKNINGLFFAGQINGTTGYEEAAAQGLLAGANASLWAQGEPLLSLGREQAYIGVLVDDLNTRGTTEPYRMFTSRAEHRLLLREDNADLRLAEIGFAYKLISAERYSQICRKRDAIEREIARLQALYIQPQSLAGAQFAKIYGQPLAREASAESLLKRPEINYRQLGKLDGVGMVEDALIGEQVQIQVKYQGYLARASVDIAKNKQDENLPLPLDLDYQKISGISAEVSSKLRQHRPQTLGQAGRISGVTPAALSLLRIYLKRGDYPKINSDISA